ncbi:MAG TPA: endonuclease VII domain-containing protein [Ktedonobacterales bacterium]
MECRVAQAMPALRYQTGSKRCGEIKPFSAFPRQQQCLYGVETVCKACKVELRQAYIAQYPERARNSALKHTYGITLADYEAMFARQGGRCAICGADDQKLVVDHNHAPRKVRSLLCHLCNALIGCARENIDILVSAAAYLHTELTPDLPAVRAAITFYPVSASVAAIPEEAPDAPISLAGILSR